MSNNVLKYWKRQNDVQTRTGTLNSDHIWQEWTHTHFMNETNVDTSLWETNEQVKTLRATNWWSLNAVRDKELKLEP